MRLTLLATFACALAAGCGSPSTSSVPAQPTSPASSHATTSAPTGSPSLDLHGAVLDLPAAWSAQKPSSSMRIAEATVPGPGGDATLAVFFFGAGGGGGTEANLQRWLGQIEPTGEPQRGSFEANGFKITWLDASGTLKPSGMGMGPSEAQPDSRLMAAVIEGAGGPWFVKLTGPATTLDPAHDAFFEMLHSVHSGIPSS